VPLCHDFHRQTIVGSRLHFRKRISYDRQWRSLAALSQQLDELHRDIQFIKSFFVKKQVKKARRGKGRRLNVAEVRPYLIYLSPDAIVISFAETRISADSIEAVMMIPGSGRSSLH
jgi:hypothetical protein